MQPYHLPYTAGQTSMDDLLRRHKVRWLGHAARKPDDVMVMQLLFAHSIPGNPWAMAMAMGCRHPAPMTMDGHGHHLA